MIVPKLEFLALGSSSAAAAVMVVLQPLPGTSGDIQINAGVLLGLVIAGLGAMAGAIGLLDKRSNKIRDDAMTAQENAHKREIEGIHAVMDQQKQRIEYLEAQQVLLQSSIRQKDEFIITLLTSTVNTAEITSGRLADAVEALRETIEKHDDISLGHHKENQEILKLIAHAIPSAAARTNAAVT